MRCTPIVTGLVLSSIVFAPASAQAQVSINLSKITCDQYVHDKIPTPDFASFSAVGSLQARATLSRWLIAAWLSGYSQVDADLSLSRGRSKNNRRKDKSGNDGRAAHEHAPF